MAQCTLPLPLAWGEGGMRRSYIPPPHAICFDTLNCVTRLSFHPIRSFIGSRPLFYFFKYAVGYLLPWEKAMQSNSILMISSVKWLSSATPLLKHQILLACRYVLCFPTLCDTGIECRKINCASDIYTVASRGIPRLHNQSSLAFSFS